MGKSAAPAKKAPSKSEVTANIAESTGLSKKQVGAVMDALAGEIKKALVVQAHKFSKSAEEKIQAAGGRVEVIPGV